MEECCVLCACVLCVFVLCACMLCAMCLYALCLCAMCLVGRGPPFAYWRKVGLQAYTKICSGVLCNMVVNIVMLLHILVVIIEH